MNTARMIGSLVLIFAVTSASVLLGFGGDEPEKSAADSAAKADVKKDSDAGDKSGAKNILRNPGVEEGEKEPKGWTRGAAVAGVEYQWDRKQGHDGKGSLSLNKKANRYFPIAQWFQIVNRQEGSTSLQVSAQVKTERASKAILDVIFLDEKDEMISHEWAAYIGAKEANDPPATHDWKEYAGKVKIPAAARKIQIGLQIYGPGKVWFDDVRAEYVE